MRQLKEVNFRWADDQQFGAPKKKGNSIPEIGGMTCTSWGFPKLLTVGINNVFLNEGGGHLLTFTSSTMKQCFRQGLFWYIMIHFASVLFFPWKKSKKWSYMTCIQYTPKHLWKNHPFWTSSLYVFVVSPQKLPFVFGGSTVLGINFSIPEALQLGHALGAESAGVSGRRGVFLTKPFGAKLDATSQKATPKQNLGRSFI